MILKATTDWGFQKWISLEKVQLVESNFLGCKEKPTDMKEKQGMKHNECAQ